MNRDHHITTVGHWLTDLSTLTAGDTSLADLRAKVAATTGVLADAFPDPRCFTRDSLIAISRQNTFFPSFGVLHRQLGDYWERNRPREFSMPVGLSEAPLTSSDRANVVVWLQARMAGKTSESDLIARLAVVRRYAEAGFQWLVNNDLFAAELAVKAKFHMPERNFRSDWADRAVVQRAVRLATEPRPDYAALGLLRLVVTKWAPENLDLLPDDGTARPAQSAAATSERRQPVGDL